jgi:hypothetical protein
MVVNQLKIALVNGDAIVEIVGFIQDYLGLVGLMASATLSLVIVRREKLLTIFRRVVLAHENLGLVDHLVLF